MSAQMDVVAFVQAYFSDWVGFVSGPVSVLLGLWGAFRKSADHRRLWIFSAAIVFFFIAPIHVWTIEHRLRLEAEQNEYPHIRADFEQRDAATLEPSKQPILILWLHLFNAGKPSVVYNYGLELETPKGKLIGRRIGLPLDITLDFDNQRLEHAGRNELGEMTANTPIQAGGGVSGILMFGLNAPVDVINASTKITLIFYDVTGKKYELHPEANTPLKQLQNYAGAPQVITEQPSSH